MQNSFGRTFGYVTAVLIGVFPALFLDFVALYADGSLQDKLSILYLVLPAYLILGFLFGWLVKPHLWNGTLALCSAAIVLVVLYTFKEAQQIVLHAAFLAVTLIGALAGIYLGNRIGKKRTPAA
ncbi:hypothetical protein CBW65_03005 [Tumebacillus avium]|uniref:TIGR04086 family membrane protein n=1 Tax=Tumebacillus avium TaxID=1903704 RepID=A0A1Y0IJ90_9BACL|nr:hypothetical protein [Tumebacillus avium]ARU60139.1 hypothetical protein CBW65_03005 [Tumebacillus avium]